MRRQCQAALRHLVRHCQATAAPTTITTTTTTMGARRFCLLQETPLLQKTPLLTHRRYSKFSTHLSEERAMELLCNLDEEERHNLRDAMGKIAADKEKKMYESHLAVGSWRTRFGRLSNKPSLGQVDPSGSFCAVPDEWLQKKLGKASISY
ncbi:uncharacterized protein LOC111082908 isoform X4 [Drosophila obscura]|uniref:uncharacterized protein LOC111082908 isoform X4 n=1 Tax=Drosophila obscura TaxID=7282 RepID=UPI001BB23D87|nr:uncharacterized protein LOC111082908 isoform X4 [Drosophila obscura]